MPTIKKKKGLKSRPEPHRINKYINSPKKKKTWTFDLEKLEKEQTPPKARRNKEIMKFRVEINERTEKQYKKSTKPKVGSWKEISKIGKSLSRLTKKKRSDSNC